MDENDENNEVRKLLSAARDASPEPPHFLKTRVLAELSSRSRAGERSHALQLRWWKIVGILSPALSIAFVLFVTHSPKDAGFHASVNQPVAVRVEVEAVRDAVNFAEVELPEGVHFYSKHYKELDGQRTLLVAWDDPGKTRLPLAIESSEPGLKKIVVRLLDANHKTVETREIAIQFDRSAV